MAQATGEKRAKERNPYADTLCLPRTDFPMRANLPTREPERLAAWQQGDLYGEMRRARAGAPKYILHDGPPYANGDVHMGTSMNKLLKDFVVKYQTMRGHDAPYVPGYDCHGLPIEFKVLQELGKQAASMTKAEIRAKCRDYALSFVDSMSADFQRLGILGTWDDPYLTLSPDYESAIVEVFGEMFHAGYITRGQKPILWCPFDQTALAEAEVEYEEHVSPSIYVRFPIVRGLEGVDGQVSIVIWTTTPWTLPANLATCVHPDFDYVIVRIGDERVIVAERLLLAFVSVVDTTDYEVLKTLKGSELEGIVYRHPFVDRECPVICGTHVTLEQGTGCVHTAPGHGQEDYVIGMQYGLEPYSPVDDQGRFTDEVPQWAGMRVAEANEPIIETLREANALVHAEPYTHSYPHCWRCKNPVIFRNTPQWFISIDHNDVRSRTLEAIRDIRWVPEWGFDRIRGMIESRPDWCVSRQRSWGVPIPVVLCGDCGAVVNDRAVSDHITELVKTHGVDVWFERTAADLVPEGTACPTCASTNVEKVEDILDVWFESGVSWRAVCEKRPELTFPADLYLEGSDQHRGWFQSSLIPSMALREQAPFRAVVTHGYVVTADGHKMSKSLGNAILPSDVLRQYGADIIRLWVASENFRGDVRLSEEILKGNADTYRGLRNTLRGLLGNLSDYDPAVHSLDVSTCDELDRYVLHRLSQLIADVTRAFDGFEYHIALNRLTSFCALDLSRLYIDVRKDRLYCDGADSPERRATQAVMHATLDALVRMLAPILAYTADETWEYVPGSPRHSVHLAAWPSADGAWSDPALAERWAHVLRVREAVQAALEPVRRQSHIGQSEDAAVVLEIEDAAVRATVEEMGDDFRAVCKVSACAVDEAAPDSAAVLHRREEDGIIVHVLHAGGEKCARCWHWRASVGSHADHASLCDRCYSVVTKG